MKRPMFKALLACLLLSMSSTAQKIEVSHGNGFMIMRSHDKLKLACISVKAMYNIDTNFQVGISGTIGRTMFADIFFNWYPIPERSNGRMYLGASVGVIDHFASTGSGLSDVRYGKGAKTGLHIGYTSPVHTRAGFYFECGPVVGIASVTETSSGPSLTTIRNEQGTRPILLFPVQAGVRYRFMYQRTKS